MSRIDPIRKFYNNLWETSAAGSKENEHRQRFHQTCRAWAFSNLDPVQEQRIIEIGPGAGFETRVIAKSGAYVLAVDVSHVSLVGLVNLDRVIPIETQGEQLPFANDSIDGIYAETMLMHTDPIAIASECARVLRSGGRAVFIEPLASHPLVNIYRRFSHYRQTHPKYLTLGVFRQMSKYFLVFEHREFYLFSAGLATLDPDGLAGKLINTVQKIDAQLYELFPSLGHIYWMTVAVFVKK